jgi:hypothetical protein
MKSRVMRKAGWWRNQIQRWQTSGVGQREFCKIHGLALSTFQLWKRRLGAESRHRAIEIVPVSITARPIPTAPVPVLVKERAPLVLFVGAGRYRLELSEGFSGQALDQTLRILESR